MFLQSGGLTLDYSRERVDAKAMDKLFALAQADALAAAMRLMRLVTP